MPLDVFNRAGRLRRASMLCAVLAATLGAWAFAPGVLAKDKASKEAEAKPAKHRHHRARTAAGTPDQEDAADRQEAQVAAAEPAALPAPPAPAAAAEARAVNFAAQLDRAGASACRGEVNALAAATLGKAEQYNTVSNWAETDGGRRAVSLAIGQKYPSGSKVPYALSEVFTAPDGQGHCDGFTVEVYPSPLSCERLRQAMVGQNNRQLGDVAGIPLLQGPGGGRTMLLATGTDACVLVATRSFYAK